MCDDVLRMELRELTWLCVNPAEGLEIFEIFMLWEDVRGLGGEGRAG